MATPLQIGRVALVLTAIPALCSGGAGGVRSEVEASVLDSAVITATPVEEATGLLRSGYRLPVVAIPEPPKDIRAKRPPVNHQCPVNLSGIIDSEDDPAAAFAIIKSGEQSLLVHRGQGVRTRAGWFAVSYIGADYIILHHGAERYRCSLDIASD